MPLVLDRQPWPDVQRSRQVRPRCLEGLREQGLPPALDQKQAASFKERLWLARTNLGDSWAGSLQDTALLGQRCLGLAGEQAASRMPKPERVILRRNQSA